MLENPMVTAQEKAERNEERVDRARERCFDLHVAEMLDALRGPAHSLVSNQGVQRPVWAVVADMLTEDANVLSLMRCLREHKSVSLLIAETYADDETEFNATAGALDV